jgi:SAM-dependent methyltransferase
VKVNRSAAVGFERAADLYERARPSYPQSLIDALPLAGATVVDLAAGTGKLTRLLLAAGAEVIALEPVDAMRAVVRALTPAAAALAEALPIRSASVDVVTVGQAFHWFDAPLALAEIARVLRPGGTLALLWNERDHRVAWVAAMSVAVHARDPGDAYDKNEDWPGTIGATGLFTPVEVHEAELSHEVDADLVVDRALSTSYIAAADEGTRDAVAAEVRAIVADFPARFDFPHVTVMFTCQRA